MQTTTPTLSDPSRAFFEVRGFSDRGGQNRPQLESPDGAFSSLIEQINDRRQGESRTDTSASHHEHAQKSADDAQSLPMEDGHHDDAEHDDDADQGELVEGAQEPEVKHHGDDNAQKTADADDISQTIKHGEVAGVSVDDEDAEADDESPVNDKQEKEGVDAAERAAAHRVDAAVNDGVAGSKFDDDGDGDGDDEEARQLRIHRWGREQPASVEEGDYEPPVRIHRTRHQDGRAAVIGDDASNQIRPVQQHHAVPLNEAKSGNPQPMNLTDEAVPPPHLEQSVESKSSRAADQREPIVVDQREQRVMPAASRVQQVESQVRLENASGQSGGTDVSSRIAVAAQTGANGSSLNGEQNGQNVPSQTAGSAERATPDDARFSGRVIRGLTAMINSRGGTMTMRLDPPDLGQMRVQMTLARGSVSASFFTQTNQARVLLEKNMAALRTALENQGLTVERLNVQTSPSSNQQGHLMNDDNAQRQQEQQRQDAAGGESRGKRDERQSEGERAERKQPDTFAEVIEQKAIER